MAFFRSLQESAFTDGFLGSSSIWAYPTVLTLHTVGMAMLVGASMVIHLRALRVAPSVPLDRLRPLNRIIWMGFAMSLASGLILFVTEAADRVRDPVFYIKLGSIGLAMWLGVVVRRRMINAAGVPPATMRATRGLAISSLGLWTMAIVAGRLMAYLKP